MTYKNLLAPGQIGCLELKNRMLVTAMGVSLAEDDGVCGERLTAYHEAQARGGAALIISGVAGVAWPVGAVQPNQIAISDERFMPGIEHLAVRVHAQGAKLALQLHHGGLVGAEDMFAGRPLWCPSIPEYSAQDQLVTDAFVHAELQGLAMMPPMPAISFKVLTHDDIRLVVGQFAAAARRAQAAGVDAVEIHAGHGYLLSSFINPASNRRDDAYGGPLQNRVRFLLDVVQAVRATVGDDYPVWVKLDSRQVGAAHGIALDDAVTTAQMLEAAGVDAITVTTYHDSGKLKLHSESHTPHVPGWNLPAARRIKAAVKIPVIASGRVEPALADAEIGAGHFDFLSMGRKILADPQLPNKLLEGKEDAIRPCVYCYTCLSAIYMRGPVRCAVNPETAFESAAQRVPGAGKRYVVVGGGPAGMEAACRLDALGHQVVLLEQTDCLGGTLRLAALAYEPNQHFLDWLRRRIAASGVKVSLNTPASPEAIRRLAPDAVLLANGALRSMPPIAGADLPHVLGGDDLRALILGQKSAASANNKFSAPVRFLSRASAALGLNDDTERLRKLTHHWMPLGQRVGIIGGDLVGLELAEFLHERGRVVTVIDESSRFGAGLPLVRRMRLLAELGEQGVALFPAAGDISIRAKTLEFTDREGQRNSISVDHVIVARGAHANMALADELRAAGFKVLPMGDCTGVGFIEGAIRGAADAVASLQS